MIDFTEEQVLAYAQCAFEHGPQVGAIYRGAHGHRYRVVSVSLSVPDLKPLVTYRGLQEPTIDLTLPLAEWQGRVRGPKGKYVPRFVSEEGS